MIEINNLTNFSVDKKLFSTVAKKVLKGENRVTETISLAFVGKEEIKKLNRKFRKKNKATDVLAFGEIFNFQFPISKTNYLGEIVICPEVVKENVERYGVPEKKEILKVFIHGILHLCGYDHEKSKAEEKIMGEKETKYLKLKI